MASEGALSRLFEREPAAGLTDNQLLDRFLTRRGPAAEAAFEALVARHGPMVARVCRGLLRAEHDVEDAFQATFLVLVRRASSIGERDRLGPWLYGVAHRVARKARARAARRRGREGDPAGIDPPARPDPAALLGVDLVPALHEEVDRLPAKYREPVILCHLQGLTHAEAARELAWPVGTVSVRLARARKLLADRLARRGVTASVASVATALATEASAAGALAPSSIAAAIAPALAATGGPTLLAGPAAVSAGAASLARRTSMTLLLSPLKWLTAPTVALVTAAGAALVGSPGPSDSPPTAQVAIPVPAPEQRATSPASPSIRATGNVRVSDQSNPPARRVYANDVTIEGTVADLKRTAESLAESNPKATFRLSVTGGELRYTGDATLSIADPAPQAEPTAEPPPDNRPGDEARSASAPKVSGDAPDVGGEPAAGGLPQTIDHGNSGELDGLNFKLAQTNRSIAVGKTTYYDVVIKNTGSEAFGRVRIDGTLQNLKVNQAFKGEVPGEFVVSPEEGDRPALFRFPEINRLVPKQSITLSLEVEGLRPGRATGTVTLSYTRLAGVRGETIERSISTVITDGKSSPSAVIGDKPDAEGQPATAGLPTVIKRDRSYELGPIPPGYFDLPAANPNKPGSPRPVKLGQSIAVEVLEALPGRPIQGRRVVRGDGTISLGFYGDLYVAGLNRDQIKVKVVEKLRNYLNDQILGLIASNNGKDVVIRPLDTDRIYVDDQPLAELDTRDQQPADDAQVSTNAAVIRSLSGQVADLSGKLDRALGAIEQMRQERAAPKPK